MFKLRFIHYLIFFSVVIFIGSVILYSLGGTISIEILVFIIIIIGGIAFLAWFLYTYVFSGSAASILPEVDYLDIKRKVAEILWGKGISIYSIDENTNKIVPNKYLVKINVGGCTSGEKTWYARFIIWDLDYYNAAQVRHVWYFDSKGNLIEDMDSENNDIDDYWENPSLYISSGPQRTKKPKKIGEVLAHQLESGERDVSDIPSNIIKGEE